MCARGVFATKYSSFKRVNPCCHSFSPLLSPSLSTKARIHWQSSVPLWEHAVFIDPELAVGHVNLAHGYTSRNHTGDHCRADNAFRAAIVADPTFLHPYIDLGQLLEARYFRTMGTQAAHALAPAGPNAGRVFEACGHARSSGTMGRQGGHTRTRAPMGDAKSLLTATERVYRACDNAVDQGSEPQPASRHEELVECAVGRIHALALLSGLSDAPGGPHGGQGANIGDAASQAAALLRQFATTRAAGGFHPDNTQKTGTTQMQRRPWWSWCYQPSVVCGVRGSIENAARHYGTKGAWAAAAALYEVLCLSEKELGADGRQLATRWDGALREAYAEVGRGLAKRDRHLGAVAVLRKATQLVLMPPRTPRGGLAEGEATATTAVRVRIHVDLATSLMLIRGGEKPLALKRREEAEAVLRSGVDLDPTGPHSGHALFNLGKVLRSMQRHADAAPIFERAVQALERHGHLSAAVDARVNAGNAHRSSNHLKMAAVAYTEALRSKHGGSSMYVAKYNLADVLFRSQRVDEARREYRDAVRMNAAPHAKGMFPHLVTLLG